MKKRSVFIFLFAVAIAVRLFFFVYALIKLPISSDEAWVGLMSMHMLKGEFPIVYWGQSYMGTQESFIDAPLIYLFGPNAFAIRIYPFVCSLLFVWFIYLLAKRIRDEEAGRIALLLLAVPIPYFSMASAVIPPDNYIAVIMLGTLSLIFTYDLAFTDSGKNRNVKYFFLGLVLGYGFWLHILMVSYIGVVLLFLLLKDKLLVFKKGFWLFVLGLVLGSLPLIYYNLTHNYATFRDVAYGAAPGQISENFRSLFKITLDFLSGARVMLYGDNSNFIDLPKILFYSVRTIVYGLIVVVVVARFKNLWRICLLSLRKVDGTIMLLAMTAAGIYVFVRSGRSNWWAVRYVLPIMSAVPVLCACGLWEVKRFSKTIFIILVTVILTAHAWGNVILIRAWNNPEIVSDKLDLPDTRPLIEFLKEENIKHAYAHFWISYRLTYETKEEIICAPPYNERYSGYDVPYADEVRKSDRAAYIMHDNLGLKPEFIENRLDNVGGKYKKKKAGKFTVFYGFEAPYTVDGLFEEVPKQNWSVSSNFKTEDAKNAVDGNMLTRWGSGIAQYAGMIYTVDMGQVYKIGKVRFDLGRFITDYPRGYRIDVSLDNKEWTQVYYIPDNNGGMFWDGSHPRFLVKGDFFTACFPPADARYVQISQTGQDPVYDWSIAELTIYKVSGEKK